jgi:predicted O-methyltransferase YrrM
VNALRRLWPYVYGALHSYNAAWELARTPITRRTEHRDARRLVQRFPGLADYQGAAGAARARLVQEYDQYTRDVSPGAIAVALELAVFATVLCEIRRPRTILDLGSGFSSLVFRRFAQQQPEPRPVVYSVDDSAPWLQLTGAFLSDRGLGTDHLMSLDEFRATSRPKFDLVLHDLGQFPTRVQTLPLVVDCCNPGGVIVIDDMHVPGYRRAVLRTLDRLGLEWFSARQFTRKRLRHSYLAIR